MPTTELVRAHIIDRMFGGLDNAANLAPLCEWCHEIQPIFRPGDEAAALDWFGLPPLDAPRLPVSVIAALADALLDGADAVTEETFSWFWGDCGATVAPTPYHPMVEARRVLRHYPEWLVSC